MNKQELIDKVSDTGALSRPQARMAVDAALSAISFALARGEEVALAGFGTFKIKVRAARTGRNPKTGESIEVPATTVTSFRPSSALKEVVRG